MGIYEQRVERAKWLLGHIKHAAMATVNEDGTPHNTPYMFMISDDLTQLYWGSNPDSRHSHNIERTGRVFVVLYEANEGGGLYIEAEKACVASGDELERALRVHNGVRLKYGKDTIPTEYYLAPSQQRMYVADTVSFWVNYADKDADGRISQDNRHRVERAQLLPSGAGPGLIKYSKSVISS